MCRSTGRQGALQRNISQPKSLNNNAEPLYCPVIGDQWLLTCNYLGSLYPQVIYKKFNISCPLQTFGNTSVSHVVPDDSCTTKYVTVNQEVSLQPPDTSSCDPSGSKVTSGPGAPFRRRTPSPSWPSPSCVIQKFCPSTQNSASKRTILGRRPRPLNGEERRPDSGESALLWSPKPHQEKNAEHRQRFHPGNVLHVLLHSHLWVPDLLW